MAKVITFSRFFPSYHPRKGEPTYFVEKLYKSIGISNHDLEREFNPRLSLNQFDPKHHTIRAGHRWKVGDWFSPRVWSGKPYNSKQIVIAPDIQIKKILAFNISSGCFAINQRTYSGITEVDHELLEEIAKNDGLTKRDLVAWFDFSKRFDGQIICWNEKLEY